MHCLALLVYDYCASYYCSMFVMSVLQFVLSVCECTSNQNSNKVSINNCKMVFASNVRSAYQKARRRRGFWTMLVESNELGRIWWKKAKRVSFADLWIEKISNPPPRKDFRFSHQISKLFPLFAASTVFVLLAKMPQKLVNPRKFF